MELRTVEIAAAFADEVKVVIVLLVRLGGSRFVAGDQTPRKTMAASDPDWKSLTVAVFP